MVSLFPPTSGSLISMATSFSFTVSLTCASMFICIVLYTMSCVFGPHCWLHYAVFYCYGITSTGPIVLILNGFLCAEDNLTKILIDLQLMSSLLSRRKITENPLRANSFSPEVRVQIPWIPRLWTVSSFRTYSTLSAQWLPPWPGRWMIYLSLFLFLLFNKM